MISTTSEYALRALTQLGRLAHGDTILGRELAARTLIPPKYLAKIMLALRNAGLVLAARGSGGGYGLLRPADAIHLIDVVQLFDGPQARPDCLLRAKGLCSDVSPCSAHAAWYGVRKAYLDFLEKTTLADISPGNQTQLSQGVRRAG